MKKEELLHKMAASLTASGMPAMFAREREGGGFAYTYFETVGQMFAHKEDMAPGKGFFVYVNGDGMFTVIEKGRPGPVTVGTCIGPVTIYPN